MIGKTIYEAKIKDGKVDICSWKIIKATNGTEHGPCYKLNKTYRWGKSCYQSDVGVVLFLTEKEALARLVKNLEHSIDMGEKCVKREKLHLTKVLEFGGDSEDAPVMFRNFYICTDCNTEWESDWHCTCDDECPVCAVPYSPYKSEDINKL
jgi:rubrerythrin